MQSNIFWRVAELDIYTFLVRSALIQILIGLGLPFVLYSVIILVFKIVFSATSSVQ